MNSNLTSDKNENFKVKERDAGFFFSNVNQFVPASTPSSSCVVLSPFGPTPDMWFSGATPKNTQASSIVEKALNHNSSNTPLELDKNLTYQNYNEFISQDVIFSHHTTPTPISIHIDKYDPYESSQGDFLVDENPLMPLLGRIVSLASTGHGSRTLQRVLEEVRLHVIQRGFPCPSEELDVALAPLVEEILLDREALKEMSRDPAGNYFIQSLLAMIKPNGDLLNKIISTLVFANKAVEKTTVEELEATVRELATHRSGSHVLRVLMKSVCCQKSLQNDLIMKALCNSVHDISVDCCGCHVVKSCLDCLLDKEYKQMILKCILDNSLVIARSHYGSGVIQRAISLFYDPASGNNELVSFLMKNQKSLSLSPAGKKILSTLSLVSTVDYGDMAIF